MIGSFLRILARVKFKFIRHKVQWKEYLILLWTLVYKVHRTIWAQTDLKGLSELQYLMDMHTMLNIVFTFNSANLVLFLISQNNINIWFIICLNSDFLNSLCVFSKLVVSSLKNHCKTPKLVKQASLLHNIYIILFWNT